MTGSRSIGASMFTPRAVKTSAPPVREDSARLPCLATGTPNAATTNVTAEDTFKVPAPSPPVPQTSMAPSGASIAVMRARMARTAPVISGTVSPRTRIAMSNAPICAGVASPDMMMVNAASASSADSVSPPASLPMVGFRSCDMPRWTGSGGASGRVGEAGNGEEVGQDPMAVLAGDAFGMELDAVDRIVTVMHGHDQPVVCPGGGDQTFRQRISGDDQAVVAGGGKWVRHALKDAGAVMGDGAELAVHRCRRTNDVAAACLSGRRVAEGGAEEREFAGGGGDQVEADAGLVRCAGTGGQDDRLGVAGERVVHRQLVVANNFAARPDVAEEMHEVEGEAVVVVDKQDHGGILAPRSCGGQREPPNGSGFSASASFPVSRTRLSRSSAGQVAKIARPNRSRATSTASVMAFPFGAMTVWCIRRSEAPGWRAIRSRLSSFAICRLTVV